MRRPFDGTMAVNLVREDFLYFGTASVMPVFRVGDPRPRREQRRHVLRLRHLDGDCSVRD